MLEAARRRIAGDPAAEGLLLDEAAPPRAFAASAAFLAFLAVLLGALAIASARLSAEWRSDAGQLATLQIVAPAAEIEAQARAALDVLGEAPGVLSVRIIDVDEQMDLLEPWLGPQVAADSLPLPLLIEIALDPAALDQPALVSRLAVEAPGAVLDDGVAWRARIVANARALALLAIVCLAGVAGLQAALTAATVRTMVAETGTDAWTLRQIGARDAFLSRAYRRRLRRPAMAALALGAAVAAALLALLPADPAGIHLVGVRPGLWWGWFVALAAPVALALAGDLAARATLSARLRRLS